MTAAEDMVEALEMYYTSGAQRKQYNDVQRRAIVKRFAWIGIDMAIKISEQVREIYDIGEYALPGVSILVKALRNLGDAPERVEQKALPMPEVDMTAYLDKHDNAVEEGAEKERARIRAKLHRTQDEEWWLKCADYGQWLPKLAGWEAGGEFPPGESLRRVVARYPSLPPLHHGKRAVVPSQE